ncbi:MAG: hypothetical protein HXS48_14770 [Theionarchaea archaeon]|nr:hypothetical protein [Theionarchaea archaeon]
MRRRRMQFYFEPSSSKAPYDWGEKDKNQENNKKDIDRPVYFNGEPFRNKRMEN